MTSPCSSGSSRVESALDPTMSQNMIVSWRRSAADPDPPCGAGPAARASAGPDGVLLERTLAPHSAQKRSSGSTACPQFGSGPRQDCATVPAELAPFAYLDAAPWALQGPAPPRIFLQYRRTSNREGRFASA